jgi:hypothetical protein
MGVAWCWIGFANRDPRGSNPLTSTAPAGDQLDNDIGSAKLKIRLASPILQHQAGSKQKAPERGFLFF